MALSNYTDLVAKIQEECDDTTAAFVAAIPDFVTKAEAWFRRELRVDDMVAATTLTASSATTALPSGFKGALSIDVDGSPDAPLDQMSLPELKRVYPTTTTGQPEVYAIADDKLWWAPVPDTSYTINLVYSASVPGLQAGETNWLMTAHPDLYEAATLAYAYKWQRDRASADEHLLLAQRIITQINKDSVKRMMGAAPIAPRGIVPQVRGVRI